jgi:hypothetical protein
MWPSEDIMNTKILIGLGLTTSVLALSGSASAQTQTRDGTQAEGSTKNLAPATHAVELTIGTGYEQAFGNIQSNAPSLTELGQAGGAVQTSVGYRILPQLTLSLYGSFAEFGRASQTDASANLYSVAAGVQSDWHFLPGGSELDPWVSLGSGWRGYWINQNTGNSSDQGMEIAKLQIGVDYRIDKAVAISPVVGADLTTFFTQQTPQSNGWSNISSPQVNTFFFAGLQGRFDIPTESSSSRVASR